MENSNSVHKLKTRKGKWIGHIAPLEEYGHNSKNTTFQKRGKTKFKFNFVELWESYCNYNCNI
jgi:hypothetical protein